MKGIMFNTRYGLEDAVLKGVKTRTWREDKKPRYDVGEIVAIKQCYCLIYGENKDFLESKVSEDVLINEIFTSAGWRNKMFVKNELMPNHIRITSVNKCRLQDLTDEDCLNEGIKKLSNGFALPNSYHYYSEPKDAFRYLIDALMGCAYWEGSPLGYAYEFELIK